MKTLVEYLPSELQENQGLKEGGFGGTLGQLTETEKVAPCVHFGPCCLSMIGSEILAECIGYKHLQATFFGSAMITILNMTRDCQSCHDKLRILDITFTAVGNSWSCHLTRRARLL